MKSTLKRMYINGIEKRKHVYMYMYEYAKNVFFQDHSKEERIIFSTNAAYKTGYPHVKK